MRFKGRQEPILPSRGLHPDAVHDSLFVGEGLTYDHTPPGANMTKQAPHTRPGVRCQSRASVVPDSFDGKHREDIRTNPEFSQAQMMSYPRWCASLLPMVLRSRTPFSAFVAKTVQLSRRLTTRGPSTPAFFPIPLPFADFGRMPASTSSSKRRRIHLDRTVHLLCMALNFWQGGGNFVDDSSLQRSPSKQHLTLYERIKALIRSDGTSEVFQISQTGRKFPNLLARLSELSSWLTMHGASSNPYDKSFSGIEIAPDNSVSPDLQPYSDLDPDRIVLHGTAQWDIREHLPDDMLMAFLEPRSILVPETSVDRPTIRDDVFTISAVAKKWDSKHLLVLHDQPVDPKAFVRIFNARKTVDQDRQIGDRRGANSQEAKVEGPSSALPAGVDLCELQCDPSRQCARISITDRKDFYHQIAISQEKSWRNTVAPAVPISDVSATLAYGRYLENKSGRYNRLTHGDRLGTQSLQGVAPPANHLWAAFGSVLQGDHVGVEVATAAHTSLLQSVGLLGDDVALRANRCLRSEVQCQGLVIDDFFCVSIEDKITHRDQSVASKVYKKAQTAYNRSSILGSPQKDLDGVLCGKTIGATFNSGPEATNRGLITLGAPPNKRISLSVITMQCCQLRYTTDALHLCLLGAWVSVLGYRRPLLSLLSKSFHLVDQNKFDQNHPRMIRLPRSVACELCLVATLMPLALTDISAAYHPDIYCSDASDAKGAYCKARVPEEIVRILWKSERSKGAYTRLLSQAEVLLKRMDELDLVADSKPLASPQKPLAFHFDFVEIFAGASLITSHMSELGFVCGPPIELSASSQYNLEWNHVASWITFLLGEKRLLAFFLCPPCTTFSIMRRPALRSAEVPYGYDVWDPQTRTGNILANRSCQIMMVGAQNDAVGLLETPFSSRLKCMPAYKSVASLPQCQMVRTDSCRFGSIHQKGFRFLGLNISLDPIALKCTCARKHVQIQGAYTKGSAIYTPKLAEAIAQCFSKAILDLKARQEEEHRVQVKGLESQLVNSVALSSSWEVCSSWTFRKQSHINILEMASMLRLANKLAEERHPLRVVNLVDSYVCRCAASKGRTSSRALSAILRRLNAISVAARLYWTFPYCPTRWNPADDPTRDTPLRSATGSFDFSQWETHQIYDLAGLPKTKRWASHWVRLVILVSGPVVLSLRDRSCFRRTWRSHGITARASPMSSLDFDATLGYPGEGPSSSFGFHAVGALWGVFVCCCFAVPRFWIAVSLLLGGGSGGSCFIFPCLTKQTGMAMAMPMFPKNPGEVARATARASRPELPSGRPVLPATNSLRRRYLDEFFLWAREEGVDVNWMLDNHASCIDELNLLATRYGRLLYSNGKTYNQFAETLNGLTSLKPAIRRLMQGAWDLGYAWVRSEPSCHHVAIPVQILLSMISVALMWGWTACAGCLALGFGGLLRPGEFLGGVRRDLTLPEDVDYTVDFALFAIRDPKTRFTQARHQSSKIDCPDLLQVIRMVFRQHKPYQRLWPMSGQTFRVRFRQILVSLSLPTAACDGQKPLDPGSLRAGGASFLLLSTEDSELVRRRGRWANHKMMEIYVQEVTALTYTKQLNDAALHRVTQTARSFPAVLRQAVALQAANIPLKAWFWIFST